MRTSTTHKDVHAGKASVRSCILGYFWLGDLPNKAQIVKDSNLQLILLYSVGKGQHAHKVVPQQFSAARSRLIAVKTHSTKTRAITR